MNLQNILDETPDKIEHQEPKTRTLTNPKNGTTLHTELTEEEAAEILAKLNNDFANSLLSQHDSNRGLSPAQYYWFFKLAEDNKPIEPIKLHSNLQEFCSKVHLLQFQVVLPDETLGKVLLRTHSEHIQVYHGWRTQGKIEKDEFYAEPKCPAHVKSLILLFSVDPMQFMLQHGKDTGRCCVCGRELTNEVSVAQGIGPICAERFAT